jgi:hypothetical protein
MKKSFFFFLVQIHQQGLQDGAGKLDHVHGGDGDLSQVIQEDDLV